MEYFSLKILGNYFVATLFLACLTFLSCRSDSSYNPPSAVTENSPLDSSYIAQRTSYFSLEDNEIRGAGKKVLLDIFTNSQFVVFGERHNSKPTSELITALIPIMNKAGYKDICFEVGPHSANKLKELSSNSHQTIQSLKEFNTKYFFAPEGSTSIPFFGGIEDAEFLEEVSRHDMNIWGIDQEYYYSILFLTDELLKSAKQEENYLSIAKSKENADAVILKWFNMEMDSEEEIDVFAKMLYDEEVIRYFNFFHESQIIKDLKISWDIYSRWRQGSHKDRIKYMRDNFTFKLNSRATGTIQQKVFVKVGQIHAAKTLSLGQLDIGHLAEEIASSQGQVSSSINSWARFQKRDGKIIDYKDDYEQMKDFIRFGKEDQWTIINLREIREEIESGKLLLPDTGDSKEIREYLYKFDYQLILPVNEGTTPNIEM